MRFVNAAGVIGKARRQVNNASRVTDEEVSDPARLVQIISELQRRVSELESAQTKEPIEFEITTTASSSHTLYHGFAGPVRWTIVGWKTSTLVAPILKEDFSVLTPKQITILSGVAGRAIIRVEPSQFTPTLGIT